MAENHAKNVGTCLIGVIDIAGHQVLTLAVVVVKSKPRSDRTRLDGLNEVTARDTTRPTLLSQQHAQRRDALWTITGDGGGQEQVAS